MALGVSGVHVEAYSWRHIAGDTYPEDDQIDLLLDWSDGVINVSEMKYCSDVFVMEAKYETALQFVR